MFEKNSLTPQIIYEDNHLLVLSKPAGMPVVPDMSCDFSLLEWGKAYIKKAKNKPGNVFLAVVHRIDRPVSGLVCFARTSKAASRLSLQLRNRSIGKHYLACVEKRPPGEGGQLVSFLKKDRRRNTVSMVKENIPGAKKAVTRWNLVASRKNIFLVRLEPLTGRSHQLRVQLAGEMKCPILGDFRYGSRIQVLDGKAIALHSWRIELVHPTRKERMEFKAPLPEYFPFSLFASFFKGQIRYINTAVKTDLC